MEVRHESSHSESYVCMLSLQALCFQCGAVPCPYNHDDSERKQRLVDLEFVKDMAKERKEFKAEITKVHQMTSQCFIMT